MEMDLATNSQEEMGKYKEKKVTNVFCTNAYHVQTCVEKKNQLDVTECFIALMICSTRFGHSYTHHQELENICVLLLPVVCSACLLVVGFRAAGLSPGRGMLHDWPCQVV